MFEKINRLLGINSSRPCCPMEVQLQDLQPIQQFAVEFFEKHFPLLGSIVEVGSDTECKVARYCVSKGATVMAINPALKHAPEDGITIIHDDARDLKHVKSNSCDNVISINTFEHIHALDLALREIERVLVPGGHLGAVFGPLWSSPKGHHLWAKCHRDIVSFWNPNLRNPVDDFAHLLLTPNDLREDLAKKGEGRGMIEAIIEALFIRGDINRWPYQRYIDTFKAMPLQIMVLEPHNRVKIEPSVQEKLIARWGNDDFGVSSLRLIARKNHSVSNAPISEP